ncbi:hypothetical protein [Sporisorium scitamineum]|uniref:Uncharacterized protein n=1 Tax=Sporisorium scitamineum TaxID=49012 RepID=A0A0F7RS84_9BASI|nr:hypothetical protein [Sporisorium scitamineum]
MEPAEPNARAEESRRCDGTLTTPLPLNLLKAVPLPHRPERASKTSSIEQDGYLLASRSSLGDHDN